MNLGRIGYDAHHDAILFTLHDPEKYQDLFASDCESLKALFDSDVEIAGVPDKTMRASHEYVYDLETFPNVFTMSVEHAELPFKWYFEISDWRDDHDKIVEFMRYLERSVKKGARMIGFNNLGFDYPILHLLCNSRRVTAKMLYDKAQAIIDSQNSENRWAHQIFDSDRIVPQLDLMKIHHFDNKARLTSLKVIEFNMRSDTIEDLPFEVGTVLTKDEVLVLRQYNAHDVTKTKEFYHISKEMVAFRAELTKKFGRDFTNHNDTKIGKDFFIMELEKTGIECYERDSNGRRVPRQTKRKVIHLNEAILPWITFERKEFRDVMEWLKEQSITETKGVFKNLTATIDGFDFDFGTGGIHGSIEAEMVCSDEEYVLIDADVKSFYPNLAIANGFYPEHLGPEFCDIYERLYEDRSRYAKGTAENAMLKLALNGVYGDSANIYSSFLDQLYTMKTTLNGQLLLCMLAEELMRIPGLRMIQANTDGLTVRLPRAQKETMTAICDEWQEMTGLQLEEAIYKRMFIRDVNNYLAEYENGDVKRIGAYEYKKDWHQDMGGLVIPKVVEKVLLHGAPIRKTIGEWSDFMDFMLRVKVPRSSYLVLEREGHEDERQQNMTRYYAACGGGSLIKYMPPLKGKEEWRRIGIDVGWGVQPCNNIKDRPLPIDYNYYIEKVKKLVAPFGITA